MPSRGHIQNGTVVPGDEFPWPDEPRVVVDVAEPEAERSIADRLHSVIGKAKDLPSDMAKNHDHYLYGMPKK